MARGNMQEWKKKKNTCLILNKSKKKKVTYAFYLMKLTGLNEEYYFMKMLQKTPKCELKLTWGHTSFIRLSSLNLENETFFLTSLP